jgi:hypothetical protein
MVKESELDIIVYYLARNKEKEGGHKHSDPWQLHDSVTEIRTS